MSCSAATDGRLILAGSGAGYGGQVLIAGAGGIGVFLGADSSLTNSFTIIGGAGGIGEANAGAGGNAVDIEGGTLTNPGTLIGGVAGNQGGSPGTPGDAVLFGNGGTLIVDPGAAFTGDTAGTADTLVLAGVAPGTLAGFGSTVTGIGRIEENAGGNRTLQGAIAGPGAIHMGPGASLTLEEGRSASPRSSLPGTVATP